MSQLWTELHKHALLYTGTDDQEFLKTWANKLPRFTTGCSCNEFWKNWSTFNKPVYTPRGAYFAWTVRAHNAVNTKLNKKIFSLKEALEIWDPENKSGIDPDLKVDFRSTQPTNPFLNRYNKKPPQTSSKTPTTAYKNRNNFYFQKNPWLPTKYH
jgi:hypothetical protein